MSKSIATLAALGLTFLMSPLASANIIVSGNGTETCEDLIGGAGPVACTNITPHGAWQANNPFGQGAAWVSYVNSGVGAGKVSVANNAAARMDVVESFNVAGSSVELVLTVWADDTAEVFIDGVSQNTPNFTQNVCANGPLGCQPHEGVTFNAILGAGVHDIRIQAYQIGGGPFGVLYSGSTTSVPAPAALGLLGFGLVGLGFGRRRK